MLSKLILIRHAESVYNAQDRFTGSIDCELSSRGKKQALEAKTLLEGLDFNPKHLHCSLQKRAWQTANIVLSGTPASHCPIPYTRSSMLNERDYGDLNGTYKDQAYQTYGREQVEQWRRSFRVCPPRGESLKATQVRVLSYYNEKVVPSLKQHSCVLLSSHGNTLRALLGSILGLTEEQLIKTEVGWAEPCVLTICPKTSQVKSVRVHTIENNPKPTSIPLHHEQSALAKEC